MERVPAHFEPVASGPHITADGLDRRLDGIVRPTWQAFAVRVEDRQVIVGRGRLKHLGGGRQRDQFDFAAGRATVFVSRSRQSATGTSDQFPMVGPCFKSTSPTFVLTRGAVSAKRPTVAVTASSAV